MTQMTVVMTICPAPGGPGPPVPSLSLMMRANEVSVVPSPPAAQAGPNQ